jgi:hypothetical protein
MVIDPSSTDPVVVTADAGPHGLTLVLSQQSPDTGVVTLRDVIHVPDAPLRWCFEEDV